MIHMRVELIIKESNKDNDQHIGYWDVYQVPDCGELINLHGDPYRVIERGWALDKAKPDEQYCYIRVLKANG